MSADLKTINFNTVINDKTVALFTIRNSHGLKAKFSNYGQHLIALWVPDNEGNREDVVLGCPSIDDYLDEKAQYLGAFIGRYANRISKAAFYIDNTIYRLQKNNGKNHLHGGHFGFNKKVWEAEQIDDSKIQFNGISMDGDQGYPGNLETRVEYMLTESNALQIDYWARTDQPTHVNFTNHSFFNLTGNTKNNILSHELMINADFYHPVDQNLIPKGLAQKVKGTPFDFRTGKKIGKDILSEHDQIALCKGYDHNFVLGKEPKGEQGLRFAAKVTEPESGRVLDVFTTEPGLQLFTGNYFDGSLKGKYGKGYDPYIGFCLETQHFPDSPNRADFPKTLLHPGEEYRSTTIYRFSITTVSDKDTLDN